MKYSLFAALLIAGSLHGQIQVKEDRKEFTVGEVKVVGSVMFKLYGMLIEGDTVYSLMFKNAKYQHITDYSSVTFTGEDGALDGLYKVLKTVLTDDKYKDKEAKLEIRLGATDIILSQYRGMGNTYVWIWTDQGYCYLSEKQINKLFGKSKNDE